MTKRIALALAAIMSLAVVLTSCRSGTPIVDEPPQALATATGVKLASTPPATPDAETVETVEDVETAAGVALNTTDHIAYITGDGEGFFNPGSDMTRAELAVVLYRLLSETVPATVSYTDVSADSWYAEAAVQLGSLGVLRTDELTFQGEEPVTRGEFVNSVAAFFPLRLDTEQFSDISPTYKYADAVLSCKAYGWLSGYEDGTFHAEQPIVRSEALAILNRALGRSGDAALITENRPALFLDVPVNAWYYYDVMEATVPHTYTTGGAGTEKWADFTETDTGLPADFRTDGLHLYLGWSYYYSADFKDIIRNGVRNGSSFDAEGHFTSGDAWIDEQLQKIITSRTNSEMTQEEMLRALFAYCRDNYKYLKWNNYETGDTSFTLDAARQILSSGRGNCYCYASTFWYLARWIGYDAKIISGAIGTGPHSWVEIDGYIYDTQLEWRFVHDYGRTSYLWTYYHRSPSQSGTKYTK